MNKLITSSGILTNLDRPRVGIKQANNCASYIYDEINQGINISMESYILELKEEGKTEEEIDELLECYESDNDTILMGNWKKDKDGKYMPDKSGEYAATYRDGIISVEWSKDITRCHHTSPCYVMADGSGPCGDLDTPGEILAYTLPLDLLVDETD